MKKIDKYISVILLMSLSALAALPAAADQGRVMPEKSTLAPQVHIPLLDLQLQFLSGSAAGLQADKTPDPFFDYTRELTAVSREEETFAFFTDQIKNLIGASGVTIYVIDRTPSGEILYRNIWRQGMEGTWKIRWRSLPARTKIAINTPRLRKKSYLYIPGTRQKPVRLCPLAVERRLHVPFRRGFGDKQNRFLDHRPPLRRQRPAGQARPGDRQGTAAAMAQTRKRIAQYHHFQIKTGPVGQILSQLENGKPLFPDKTECREKLKTVSLLARQTAMALCYHRSNHYLAHKYPDAAAEQRRLKTIARIYEEDVGRSVHSSKNFLITGLPGWANLMLRRIKKQESASAVYLAQQLAPHVEALNRRANDPVLEKLLRQFEEQDMRIQMETIRQMEENPAALLFSSETSASLVRDAVAKKSANRFDAPKLWDALTQLYFHAGSLPEINRIHEQARALLRNNPPLLEKEMALYRFAAMVVAPEQEIKIQGRLRGLEETNIEVISTFIARYRSFYEQTAATIHAVNELAATEAAQPFRELFDNFARFGKDYLTINRQFFELAENIMQDIQPSERKLDIQAYNAAKLLGPYKFPLDILGRKQLPHIVGIEYSFSYSLPEDLWLNTDATELNLIMDNLFSNAVKYSDKGGHIALNVRAVRTQRQGIERDMIAISLKDEGRGIAPEKLHLVGKHHERLGAEHDPAVKGSGIGLAYVKHCVEKMDGYFEVYSEGLGKGSTFTVYLPAAPADAASAGRQHRATDPLAETLPAALPRSMENAGEQPIAISI